MVHCPIKGCKHQYAYGILGWDSHVARLENHVSWQPQVTDPEARKRWFQRDFQAFFDQALTPRKHISGTQIKAVHIPAKKAASGHG